MSKEPSDLIIVGAGLSGLLTAWRCLDVNPQLSVTVIDASDKIAGDHTWSFNYFDIPKGLWDWIKPFINKVWLQYDVKFPDFTRTLDIPYCTGNSSSLRDCVQPFIDEGRLKLCLNTKVRQVTLDHVECESGEKMAASAVLDARGFEPNENVFLGYQKFVGQLVQTAEPHGLERPILMDATVKQLGGYRFLYCLPFSEDTVLIEDTYYTDEGDLPEESIAMRIGDYAASQGWKVAKVIRQEKGILPITLARKPAGLYTAEKDKMDAKIGLRGGLYHDVTGYSFPDAIRTADQLAEEIRDGEIESLFAALAGIREVRFERGKFFRLLNRMLFRAAKPEQRYRVLQRFYGLPRDLIERFYWGTLLRRDKARILLGKPPVPVFKALYNFSEKAFIKRERAQRTKPNA